MTGSDAGAATGSGVGASPGTGAAAGPGARGSSRRPGKVVLLVCDSLGVGEAPDAADYGDQGADTLRGLGGDDIIDAVDVQNIKDKVIDCGNGNDTALVNAADAPVACETVTRS